jgi:glycosyltransferase involved in cell wall biosynthesis
VAGEKSLKSPSLSIVVPLYNEEESLPLLHGEIRAALDPLESDYEIIFIDDGSRDTTLKVARELAARDPHVVVVALRRNYGQTAALQAGIDHTHGDIVVSMDGDLQNDPADIPRFLEMMEQGYEVVCGWRKDRKDALVHRKIPSMIANRLLRAVSGVGIHDTGCSLKAYRGDVIRNARLYSDMHRFIAAMTAMAGARVGELVVNHRARTFGQTKYGISRTWKVMADLWTIKMIVGFATRPIRWFIMLGLPWLLLSGASLAMTAWLYLQVHETSIGVVPVVVTALFTFAFLHVVLLGAISELALRTGQFRETDVIVARRVEG